MIVPILSLVIDGEEELPQSDSKGQPWPSQEQSQLLFGCFAALCSVVQWNFYLVWETSPSLGCVHLISPSHSASCSGLLFTWVTCCTRFPSSTAWPSSARREKWRASSEWRFRPYQVRLGLLSLTIAETNGMKGFERKGRVWLPEGVKWRCFVFPSSWWGSSRLRLRSEAVRHCQNLIRGSAVWKGRENCHVQHMGGSACIQQAAKSVSHLAFAVPVWVLLCRTVPYRDFPRGASYRGGWGAERRNGSLSWWGQQQHMCG